MGLTLHWKLHSLRQGKKAQHDLLLKLQELANELHHEGLIEEVGDLRWFDMPSLQAVGKDEDWQWWHIQSKWHVERQGHYYMVPPEEGYGLSLYPGPGCEPANFGLMRYPKHVPNVQPPLLTGAQGWRWSSFCKTTYAERPLTCHLALIALLDWLDQQPDVKLEVHDEGEYWEKRDPVALAREFVEDATRLAGFAHFLLEATQDSPLTVQSPILTRADYPELAAKGRMRLMDDAGAHQTLTDLLRFIEDGGG